MCFSAALIVALAFWRLRNSQPTRVAALTVRTSESVIPAYWFVASAICALLVLSFGSSRGYELSAIIVCVSALLTTFIAWRMTLLPALLTGEDIPAEELVDQRLRFNRSTTCMIYALVQTFVFCSQFGDLNAQQLAIAALSLVLWAAFGIWFTFRRRRQVRLA
jgi:TRAP-type C4-dicarboxylate transport system permease large subunit